MQCDLSDVLQGGNTEQDKSVCHWRKEGVGKKCTYFLARAETISGIKHKKLVKSKTGRWEQDWAGVGQGSWWGCDFSLPFCAFWILKLVNIFHSLHDRYFRPCSGGEQIKFCPREVRVWS